MKNKYSVSAVFFETVRTHLWTAVLTAAVIISSAICALIPPIILGNAVDALTQGHAIAFHTVVSYFCFTALSGFLEAFKEALIAIFGQKMTHGLRSEMSKKLYRLPASYFVKNSPGEISSRFVNDVDTVEDLFSSGIISMFSDLLSVISIMAVIFTKSRGLGILLMIALPVIFYMTRVFQKRMLKAQIANRNAIARANAHIPDTLRNIRAAHVFHAESFLERKYSSYIDENYQAMEQSNFYDAVYSPIVVTVSSLVIAIMMTLAARGGKYTALFGMSVGTAVTVISYVGKVFDPIENIGMEIQSIQSAAAGIHKIRVFENEPERKLPDMDTVFDKQKPAVCIDDITFGYDPDQPVLNNFSLTVNTGETLTLAGRTGCGKSTLMKLILGLYHPEKGSVQIYGVPADQISDEERRQIFGYVEQNFVPVDGTVKDQLRLQDARVKDADMENALHIVGMDQEIKKLKDGMDTEYNDALFSQGQRQLLSVARAIVLNPSILLLDEINANLDADTERRLSEALRKASKGRTVISISHRTNNILDSRTIQMDRQ